MEHLPQHINDPVLMASHILISLQQEINRKSPSDVPTVLSFGKVMANGAVNVIPDQVTLEGTFRTMNETWRKEAHRLIEQIADGIAPAWVEPARWRSDMVILSCITMKESHALQKKRRWTCWEPKGWRIWISE